jgi:outer membrane protein assembly factor BamB
MLFVGTAGGKVVALHATSGEKIWEFTTKKQILSSPALGDGAVFQGSDDKSFYALEQGTGRLRWQYNATGEFTGGPTVVGDLVIVAHSGGEVLAFEMRTGKVRWRAKADGAANGTPAADGEHVYFGDDAGEFTKVLALIPTLTNPDLATLILPLILIGEPPKVRLHDGERVWRQAAPRLPPQ